MTSMDAKGSQIHDGVRYSKIRRDIWSKLNQWPSSLLPGSTQASIDLRHHRTLDVHHVGRDFPRFSGDEISQRINQSYNEKDSNRRWFKSIFPIYSVSSFIVDLRDWIDEIEAYFDETQTPERLKCRIASYTLKGEADCWWCQLEHHRFSWWRMKHLMAERFIHTRCSTKLPNRKEMEESKAVSSSFLSGTYLMKWSSQSYNNIKSENYVRNLSEACYQTTTFTETEVIVAEKFPNQAEEENKDDTYIVHNFGDVLFDDTKQDAINDNEETGTEIAESKLHREEKDDLVASKLHLNNTIFELEISTAANNFSVSAKLISGEPLKMALQETVISKHEDNTSQLLLMAEHTDSYEQKSRNITGQVVTKCVLEKMPVNYMFLTRHSPIRYTSHGHFAVPVDQHGIHESTLLLKHEVIRVKEHIWCMVVQ